MKKINKIFFLICMLFVLDTNVYAKKDETIYTVMDHDGNIKNSSVVNHLYSKSEETKDETLLKDILNINGDEIYTFNHGVITWQNKGKNIFYSGTIEKDLPIKTTIKYYLDGKEISSKDLVDKSGNVKIEFTFTNNNKNYVYVNGKSETLYTPFVVSLGTIINDSNISNLSITNGKSLSTGRKNILVGIAAPGMYESLGLNELKDLNKIVISYNTTKYTENTFYMVMTPKLLENSDLSAFNKMNTIFSSTKALQTNMDALVSGSNEILTLLTNKINLIQSEDYKLVTDSYRLAITNGSVSSVSTYILSKKNDIKDSVVLALTNNESLKSENVALKTLVTLSGSLDSANAILNNTNKCNSTNVKALKEELLTNTTNTDRLLIAIARSKGAITDETPSENYIAITNSVALELIESCDAYNTALEVANSTLEGLKVQIPEIVYNTLYDNSKKVASMVSNGVITTLESAFKNSTVESLNELASGLEKLNAGINKYNDEGIKELSKLSSKLENYKEKVAALVKLSENYKGYGSNNASKTTFVTVIK